VVEFEMLLLVLIEEQDKAKVMLLLSLKIDEMLKMRLINLMDM